MTYNVGSGRENFGTFSPEVMETITALSPDILGVQETTEWIDAEGNKQSITAKIAQSSEFGENYFFGKTLSLKENMQVKKKQEFFSDSSRQVLENMVKAIFF